MEAAHGLSLPITLCFLQEPRTTCFKSSTWTWWGPSAKALEPEPALPGTP